jgi:hypothetical protein
MLFNVTFSRICLVSLIGTFEYMLATSREAKLVVGVTGVRDIWLIRSVELVTINAYGRGRIG